MWLCLICIFCIIDWTSAVWYLGVITTLACCCGWIVIPWGIYWGTGGGGGGEITGSFFSAYLRRSKSFSTIALALWKPSSSIVLLVSRSSWWAWQKFVMKFVHVFSVVVFLIHLLTSLRNMGCLDTIKYPMLTCCLAEYRQFANSAILHRSLTELKISSIGSLTLYASFVVSSYFVWSSFSLILPYVLNRWIFKSRMSAGNCPVIRFRTAFVFLDCTEFCTNAINDICIKMYVWCSRRAALY